MGRVNLVVVRRRHHRERCAGLDRHLERRQIGVVVGRDVVGDPGMGVSVLVDPAQTREMFDGSDDAGLCHAVGECRAVRADHGSAVTVFAVEPADRRVHRAAGHRVHHGGQVHRQAGRAKLAAPRAGAALQRRRGPGALRQPGRDARESAAGKDLNVATLLVGADEQWHSEGRRRRGPSLQSVRDRPCRADARRASTGQDDVADVVTADRRQRRGSHAGRGAADHEQLPNPLGLAHLVEHDLGAPRRNGSRPSNNHVGGRTRARRNDLRDDHQRQPARASPKLDCCLRSGRRSADINVGSSYRPEATT